MVDTYRYFEPNEIGKDFVCGDIHGCFSDLEDQLKNIGFDRNVDRLFCVGDLIDRGPESERCVEFMDYPWFYSIRGNHEELAIEGYEADVPMGPYGKTPPHRRIHEMNGGVWFYTLPEHEQRTIISLISELPYMIQVGDFGLIHAEVPFGTNDWKEATRKAELRDEGFLHDAVWSRKRIDYGSHDQIQNIGTVYVGHTIMSRVKRFRNVEYIDTGSYLKHRDWDNTSGFITVKEMGT